MDDKAVPDAPAPNPATPGQGDTPQVRTLLLTDLCESTSLVERLGDALAAALFREHDRLVLELQQRWRGRLIDRSDGLLLLFERPIDGLGFALDYMRGLHELGKARKLNLQARAGLHVGEVLTWLNSDEAVRAGAKSLEVEGIAKPLAGRLMSLARPGQILLSAVAEPMSHRAASELGERGRHLVWKSYGRWRFKGVPNAQEIFEVGEPGLAALRMPKHNAKAWRDIPLWRRPAALAAEVLLVVGLGTGAWFLTRPQPAIAFNERDWVVVGDLRNLTGQPVLDESLEQAFRISLEQSRYVNVLSDLKVRDTLALMKRKPDEPLDRATASEVAIRDGARAVILPTVAEVGGRVRVSAEVVDPHTQTTVYAESADGAGAVSALDSIDRVTGELRNKLGEAIKSIQRDSTPLPQVTTSNLDALKAYALGEKKYAVGDVVEALGYFRRALELDPKFALAKVAIGRLQAGQGQLVDSRQNLEAAAKMREHLSAREALTLDTLLARFGPVSALLARWQQLIEMYPDALNAQMGYAQDGWMMANRYSSMLPHARAATAPQYVGNAKAHYLEGMLQLGMERYDDAIASFETSRAKGYKAGGAAYAYAYEAQGKSQQADRIFHGRAGTELQQAGLTELEYRFITSINRGLWEKARHAVAEAIKISQDPLFDTPLWRFWSMGMDAYASSTPESKAKQIAQELAWVEKNSGELDQAYGAASINYTLAIGYLAALLDDQRILSRAITSIEKDGRYDDYPMASQMYTVLLAEHDRLQGKPQAAVERLKTVVADDESLILAHSSLLRAHRDGGNHTAALQQAEWLLRHRGRAFVERGTGGLLDPLVVADITLARLDAADALRKLDRHANADSQLSAFHSQWPANELPEPIRSRADKLAAPRAVKRSDSRK